MPLRAFTPAELLLTERRRLERPLLVMVWLGIVSFGAAEGEAFHPLLATLAVLVNLVASTRRKELSVRRLFINLGLGAATVLLLVEAFRTEKPQLVVLAHYIVLILVCKLFEQKRNRDYLQMLAMSVLLMLAACLISDALWTALALAAFVALACHTAMVFTLKRGLDAAASKRLAGERVPPEPRRLAWNVLRDWPVRPIRRLGAAGAAAILATGVAMFFLAPRGLTAVPGLFEIRPAPAQTGYGSEVELGQPGAVHLSDRIVLRVKVTRNGRPVTGSSLYLRGQTFDAYAHSKWARSQPATAPAPSPARRPLPLVVPPANALVQEVLAVPDLPPCAFAVYPAVYLDASGRRTHLDLELNHTILRPEGLSAPVRYTAYTWPAPLTDRQRETLRQAQVPPRPRPGETVYAAPPVEELARQWCADLLDARARLPGERDRLDLEIARRLAQRLEERCTYTLDLSAADPDRDGVEDFLFHLKSGHCEYFASALTVMCRRLDVQARLAAGFLAEPPAPDGVCLVRQRDAHAWCEVFTPSTDWVIVDPSPRGAPARARAWWAGLRDFWESLNFAWYENVAGYDALSRDRMLASVADAADRAAAVFARMAKALGRGFQELLTSGQVTRAVFAFSVALGALCLGLEALLILRAVRRARRLPWRPHQVPVPPAQLRFVVELFTLLRRHGYRPAPGRTALAAVREAAGQLRLPQEALVPLVELYYRLRWAGAPARSDELQEAGRLLRELRRLLRHGRAFAFPTPSP